MVMTSRCISGNLAISDSMRATEIKKDQAAENLRAAQTRYQIVEDHGIPISGAASSRGNTRK